MYASEYEKRCRLYEAHPSSILENLWAGNLSIRREDCLRVGLGSVQYTERYHPDRDLGIRLADSGLLGRFDRRLLAHHVHTRDLCSFRRDARSQGAGRLRLAQLHAETVGGFSLDDLAEGVPAGVAALIRLARRPRAAAPLAFALAQGVRVCGEIRFSRGETAFARVLRRVEQTRGAVARLADPANTKDERRRG